MSAPEQIGAVAVRYLTTLARQETTMTAATDLGDYVRRHYGVPAHIDGRITSTHTGCAGTIVGFDGQYLLVRFDGDDEPVHVHPTWRVEYHAAA